MNKYDRLWEHREQTGHRSNRDDSVGERSSRDWSSYQSKPTHSVYSVSLLSCCFVYFTFYKNNESRCSLLPTGVPDYSSDFCRPTHWLPTTHPVWTSDPEITLVSVMGLYKGYSSSLTTQTSFIPTQGPPVW